MNCEEEWKKYKLDTLLAYVWANYLRIKNFGFNSLSLSQKKFPFAFTKKI